MINPRLPACLWSELCGRLWHATSRQGLSGIVADGCIRVGAGEPYGNSVSRGRNAVCLFDFGPEATDQDDFMRGNWLPWLGAEHAGGCAIWLEIDRQRAAERLIGPAALLATMRQEKIHGRLFAGIEACHHGPIPTSALAGALLIDGCDCSLFRRYDGDVAGLPDKVAAFLTSQPSRPRPSGVTCSRRHL